MYAAEPELEPIPVENGIVGLTSNCGSCTELRNTNPISNTHSKVYTTWAYVWPKKQLLSTREKSEPLWLDNSENDATP